MAAVTPGPTHLWKLSQWADDLRALCRVLGISKPIVYGASFGGLVAMTYAQRHPKAIGKLILVSTTAQAKAHAQAKVDMFRRLGGDVAGDLAHRRFILGDTSPEVLADWLKIAVPLYQQTPQDPAALSRMVRNVEATAWFNRTGGEGRSFDLLAQLSQINCPTLVMGGALDPMTPIECQRDIAAALPQHLVQYREFAHCGHGVVDDAPEDALAVVRSFIQG